MRQRGKDAHHPEQLLREHAHQGGHDDVGEEPAGGGEEEGGKAAREHAAQHEPDHKHGKGVPPAKDDHGHERDDIGQAELDARYGQNGRDLALGHEYGQSHGRQRRYESDAS